MTKLYVVRHCKAEGQPPGAPLTPEGLRQAETLAAFFADKPVDRIISSPFLRARQSVEPLARRLGLPVEEDPRLGELLLMADGPDPDWRSLMARTFADPALSLGGGETTGAAAARAAAVVDELFAAGTSSAVIVTHGYLMTLLLHRFDQRFGLPEWALLSNPDVFLITDRVERIWKDLSA